MDDGNRNLDLTVFLKALVDSRNFIIILVSSITFIVILYSLTIDNIYRATSIVVTTEKANSQSSSGSAAASLASLAGISLAQGDASSDKGSQALKILESRLFIINFLKTSDLIPEIMAEESWNSSSQSLKYSSDFDQSSRTWKRNEPSEMSTYREFISNHLRVVKDVDTGFISISVNHISPLHADMILKELIKGINNHMREIDLASADNAISYLTEQLQLTNINEIRNVLSNVIEDQIQTKMLANITEEYIFRVLDPSRIPDRKFSPRRSAIVMISLAISFSSVIFVSFILFIQGRLLKLRIYPLEIKINKIDQ